LTHPAFFNLNIPIWTAVIKYTQKAPFISTPVILVCFEVHQNSWTKLRKIEYELEELLKKLFKNSNDQKIRRSF
jgi:hypothetical protein